MRAKLVQNEAVALRAADWCDVAEVLRCAAQHRWTADVDHLDRLQFGDALLRRDLLERVEVDADEVERRDLVLRERGDVFRVVAAGQDAGVDAGVQCLDAAAEHLRELGQRLDPLHGQAELLEVGRGATARDELPAEVGKPAREDVEPCLVICGDQRAHSSSTMRGSSRCSISLMRACSVSGVSPESTGTRSCARIGPLSTPSSTRCTVVPDSAIPAASCSSTAWAPGNSGRRDGCTFTTAFGNLSRNE